LTDAKIPRTGPGQVFSFLGENLDNVFTLVSYDQKLPKKTFVRFFDFPKGFCFNVEHIPPPLMVRISKASMTPKDIEDYADYP